jgi:hypothetical protein
MDFKKDMSVKVNRSPEGGGGQKHWSWPASAQEAFQNAKCLLAAAVPLQHPAPNAEMLSFL